MGKTKSYAAMIKPQTDEIKKTLKPRVLEEIEKMMEVKEIHLIHTLKKCESPIEQLFCLRLMDSFEYQESTLRAIDSSAFLAISVQKEVEYRGKKYRPDFTIECYFLGEEYKFAIECDGHDYHEKTKEQAKRDKSRDRDLQKIGFRVIHFTGSEIWEDPYKCVWQTFNIIEEITGFSEKVMEQFRD